jgi:hypothetical protein
MFQFVQNAKSMILMLVVIMLLNVQLKICKNEVDKVKFARDAFTIGRHPSIKDGLGFQKEPKTLRAKRTSTSQRRRGGTYG